MANVVGIWGAITGSLALAIAGYKEFRSSRTRVAITHHTALEFALDTKRIVRASSVVRVRNLSEHLVEVGGFGLIFDDGRTVAFMPDMTMEQIRLKQLSPGVSEPWYAPLSAIASLTDDPLTASVTPFALVGDRVVKGVRSPLIVPNRGYPASVVAEQLTAIEKLNPAAALVEIGESQSWGVRTVAPHSSSDEESRDLADRVREIGAAVRGSAEPASADSAEQ